MEKLRKSRKGQIALMYLEKRVSEITEKESQEKLVRELPQIAKTIDEYPHSLSLLAQQLQLGVIDYSNHVAQRIAIKWVKQDIKNRSDSNLLAESNRRRVRSEERRVGKECRSRWSADH